MNKINFQWNFLVCRALLACLTVQCAYYNTRRKTKFVSCLPFVLAMKNFTYISVNCTPTQISMYLCNSSSMLFQLSANRYIANTNVTD